MPIPSAHWRLRLSALFQQLRTGPLMTPDQDRSASIVRITSQLVDPRQLAPLGTGRATMSRDADHLRPPRGGGGGGAVPRPPPAPGSAPLGGGRPARPPGGGGRHPPPVRALRHSGR